MAGLGSYLSHLREERGRSIGEMARVTRVAPSYLEALERDDFTALPAAVFTKGYIRAYCQALDVPVEEALSRYSAMTEVAVVTPTPPVGSTTGGTLDNDRRRSSGTLLVSFVLLVGFGLALFGVALFLQSGRPEVGVRGVEPPTTREASVPVARSAPEEPATSPPAEPAPVAPPPPVASASPVTTTPSAVTKAPGSTVTNAPAAVVGAPTATAKSPAVATSAPSATTGAPSTPPASVPRSPDSKSAVPTDARSEADPVRTAGVGPELAQLRLASVASPYRLVARTQEATWLRVRTEDGRATEETVPGGEVREWVSNRPFVVTIGNAAGVALELNGQKLPPLGGRGVAIFRLILPPPEP
jgi:cytoskeleton protein RodZ